MNDESEIVQERDDAAADFAWISGDASDVVVVEGDDDHLQQERGRSEDIGEDHAGRQTGRRLEPVVEPHLRSVFDDHDADFDVAENVDDVEP